MPRIETTTRTLYTFDELDEQAKQRAIDKFREHNLDYAWWEFVYEDAKTIGALMGITVDRIGFSGFSSQGDGAHFEGSYKYISGAAKAVAQHTGGTDTEIVRIAAELQRIQKGHFYRVTATVKHRGHYQHEMCTDIYVDDGGLGNSHGTEDAIKEVLRDFMRWIYKRLETEYDYLQSDEQIAETIKANGYEFHEDGAMA